VHEYNAKKTAQEKAAKEKQVSSQPTGKTK